MECVPVSLFWNPPRDCLLLTSGIPLFHQALYLRFAQRAISRGLVECWRRRGAQTGRRLQPLIVVGQWNCRCHRHRHGFTNFWGHALFSSFIYIYYGFVLFCFVSLVSISCEIEIDYVLHQQACRSRDSEHDWDERTRLTLLIHPVECEGFDPEP